MEAEVQGAAWVGLYPDPSPVMPSNRLWVAHVGDTSLGGVPFTRVMSVDKGYPGHFLLRHPGDAGTSLNVVQALSRCSQPSGRASHEGDCHPPALC